MGVIRTVRKQNAIYWEIDPNGNDRYGRGSFLPPVAIKCRWDDRCEEFPDAKGVIQTATSVVMVDREMSIGGYLKFGALDSIDVTKNPMNISGAFRIEGFGKTPNFRCTEILYEAYLKSN